MKRYLNEDGSTDVINQSAVSQPIAQRAILCTI